MANYISRHTGEEFDNSIENFASEYSTSQQYAIGNLVVYEGKLYKCITATSGAWDNTKWEYKTVAELLEAVPQQTVKGNGTAFGATTAIDIVPGNNVTVTADTTNNRITIAATDTTYSSKSAVSGGTDVSLVTTGEKYTWNNIKAVPSGGTTGQVLTKTASGYGWSNSGGGFVISGSQPADTSLLWIDSTNNLIKYYINGSWKAVNGVWG